MSCCFIIHGRLRDHALVKELERSFSDDACESVYSAASGDGIDLAYDAAQRGYQTLVAVGGDGTVNEVTNGILRFGLNNHTDQLPRLAVFPLGSGNDVARAYDWSSSPAALRRRVRSTRRKAVDVLALEFDTEHDGRAVRYCLNVADIGLGADVSLRASKLRTISNASLRYAYAALRSLFSIRARSVILRFDESTWQGNVISVCMANHRYFGSGMAIAPDADPTDGWADLTVIGDVGVWDYLRQLPSLRASRKLQHPRIFYERCRTAEITAEIPLFLEIDGECVGRTPVHLRVIPSAIDLAIE